MEQRWIEVTVDTQVGELIKAVKHGFTAEYLDNAGGVHRTMVFANTVEAVDAVAKILLRSGIECLLYHKNCTLEERAQTLVDFHEKGGVLVCTDAAARGVDIPNVLHVIQVYTPFTCHNSFCDSKNCVHARLQNKQKVRLNISFYILIKWQFYFIIRK